MKKVFLNDRAALLNRSTVNNVAVFSDKLTARLPEPIRKYLRLCGYMNTLLPVNADVHWAESSIRLSPDKDWAPLETLQFNSVKPLGRVAYMRFLSMPVAARDLYRDGYGEMNGKLFSVFPVVYDNSPEVAQSALITAFCEFMFIPGYVLLEAVAWEQIDDWTVRGTLSDSGIEVTIGEKENITWHLPEGHLEYFKGVIDRVEFNVRT